MDESSTPRRRLPGLDPEALMSQGMKADEALVSLNGIVIETSLGRGGMGAVYLGRQLSLDREVAIKVLASELADDPQFLARLEREARVMAMLKHPNIVAVHDFQRTEEGAAIVMEFVDGGSLRDLLLKHPKGLPVAEALRILRQIAAGLETAHACGVIHRDMKPENVLIDVDGMARVTDFGLALPLAEGTSRLTLTGTAVGTIDYMAPEQLKGAEADERLDVYALGVIAYELITGQTPRGSFEAPHRLRKEVPATVGVAIMKALRPDAADRFPSIGAFMEALQARPRRVWPWIVGACAALAVVAWSQWPTDLSVVEVAGPWRDAIAGTRIYEDVISGDWKNEDGVLTSNEQICIVKLEDDMPESYDVRMRFVRMNGVHSVALFFQMDGATVSAELDAWREGLAGVQTIGGEDLRNGYGFRFPIENGRTYELLVEVRHGLVRMNVDGVLMKEFQTAGATLSPPIEWEWQHEDRPAALAVASYMASTRFETVEWRPVSTAPATN